MLRKVLARVNTQRVTRRWLAALKNYLTELKLLIVGGGGVVAVPSCVDCMMIFVVATKCPILGRGGFRADRL